MLRVSLLALAVVSGLVSSQTIDQLIASAAADAPARHDASMSHDTVLVELDMKFPRQEWENIQRKNRIGHSSRPKRKAYRDSVRRWPNKEIPYIVSSTFSEADKAEVKVAIDIWQKYTCIKFRRATPKDINKLVITDGRGCSSYVGMVSNSSQTVELAPGCRKRAVIIHQLGHAIGFFHEHNRPDRDKYVKIHVENVKQDQRHNFQLYSWAVIENFCLPYDYLSIMHYGPKAFSQNGKPTIETIKERHQKEIGKMESLISFFDIKLANLMYECNSHCQWRRDCQWENQFVGKDCECWCPSDIPAENCKEVVRGFWAPLKGLFRWLFG